MKQSSILPQATDDSETKTPVRSMERMASSRIVLSKELGRARVSEARRSSKAGHFATQVELPMQSNVSEESRWHLSKNHVMLFLLQPIVIVILISFGKLLDRLISNSESSLSNFVDSILYSPVSHTKDSISVVITLMTTIIAIVFQISAIMMQIAASQFTQDVFLVLMTDPKLGAPILLWLSTALYSLILSFGLSPEFSGSGHLPVLMVLSVLSLLMLPVYFFHLIRSLDPTKIINQLLSRALVSGGRFYYTSFWWKGEKLPKLSSAELSDKKLHVISMIEAITAICLKAVQRGDNHVAYHSVEAMRTFVIVYGGAKTNWSNDWFSVPDRESPDTFSLSADMIDRMQEKKVWVEWKILRQFQRLFRDGVKSMEDLCYVVGVNTRKIAEAAAMRDDMAVLDKVIRFFNTYLRNSINARNAKVMFNVLHEYRLMVSKMLELSNHSDSAFSQRVIQRVHDSAEFFLYYLGVCVTTNMTFLITVIAQDIGEMVAVSTHIGSPCSSKLLDTLLRVGVGVLKTDNDSWRGIHRAQVRLACILMDEGKHQASVEKIARSLVFLPSERLQAVMEEMEKVTAKEFWEINDRQENLDYLTPGQKRQLDIFHSLVRKMQAIAGSPNDPSS